MIVDFEINERKKILWVSCENQYAWGGDIVGYINKNNNKLLSKKQYEEMIEKEIFNKWYNMDIGEIMEYKDFEDFRKNILDNPDNDYEPLVEVILSDYDDIDYQALYGEDLFGGTTLFGGITDYIDVPGVWTPDNLEYYDDVLYDAESYSFMGCFQTGIIGNGKGLESITWEIDLWNNDTYIQYREYDISTSTFGSWGSLQNTTNRFFKFNLGNVKAVQFRIYLPNENIIVYLNDIEQSS